MATAHHSPKEPITLGGEGMTMEDIPQEMRDQLGLDDFVAQAKKRLRNKYGKNRQATKTSKKKNPNRKKMQKKSKKQNRGKK